MLPLSSAFDANSRTLPGGTDAGTVGQLVFLQTCAWIKAKVIYDGWCWRQWHSNGLQVWTGGGVCRWERVTQMVSATGATWSGFGVIVFLHKGRKKKPQPWCGHGSVWLIMNAQLVQSVATLPSRTPFFLPFWTQVIPGLFFPFSFSRLFSSLLFTCFYFDLGLYWACIIQAYFLQEKKGYSKNKYMENKFKLFCAIKVICRFFFFFFLINNILLMLNCWEYGMLY